MKITWQDVYTTDTSDVDYVIKDIEKGIAITDTYGKLVYEDKKFIILCKNKVRGIPRHDDFITIPKSLILKRSK